MIKYVPLGTKICVEQQAMYNTATLLLVSGFTAVALTSGLLARELVSIYKIPSRSMDPTILSGHRVGQLKHAVEV